MHTYDGNLCRLGHLGPARPHPGVAGVGAGVVEADGDERQGPVPDVVGEGRYAGLLHRHSILHPNDDGHVQRRVDKLGLHVDLILAVNHQGDIGGVLLLADQNVGGADSVSQPVLFTAPPPGFLI